MDLNGDRGPFTYDGSYCGYMARDDEAIDSEEDNIGDHDHLMSNTNTSISWKRQRVR